MKWDFEGDYLKQFPRDYTGTIGDRFCRAVRAGAEDVMAVLDWVANDLADNPNPVWQEVQKTCSSHATDVWDFAAHILDREALPWDEKQRLKKERAINPKWKDDAPSEKQLKYLKALGCVDVPTTKGEASELINQLVNSRQPTVDYDPDSLPF